MWDDYIDDDGCESFEGENDADDLLDELFEEHECLEREEVDGGECEPSQLESNEDIGPGLNLTNAIVIGSMVAGQAYDKARLERLKTKPLE